MTEEKENKKKVNDEEISEEQKQIEDLTETLRRLQAEFENYKKRVERENSNLVKCASEQLIKRLLPVLDSFEQALKSKEMDTKGVELVYAQLFSVLEEQGLEKIDCEGKEFDPLTQEVLLQEESDNENIVLEELQKGYMLNDKLIRTAKIKIGIKKQGEK